MPEDQSLEELYYVNGINGSTGAYLEVPLSPQQVGDAARGLVAGQFGPMPLNCGSIPYERATNP